MYKLTKHEELVLTSIWKLTGNAYIVTIRRYFADITGKTINSGSLCNTLTSLVRKGLIESRESQPTAQQGGRRKVLYALTREGRKALNQAYTIQKRAWKGFTEFNV
ncbi:PadR family transcriptional regulator [Acidobacteriota bacterium]